MTSPELLVIELSPDQVQQKLDDLRQNVRHPFNAIGIMSVMFEVAEQLNPSLASYDLVVGDDVSGRLPAILYWRLANARRLQNGLPRASIRFINGRWGRNGDLLPDCAFRPEPADGSRSLIVTEHIQTGASVVYI